MSRSSSIHVRLSVRMCAVLDIPYRGSEDNADADSLQYVDAGTVNVVVSTSRTASYWETHQMSPPVNAAAFFIRTTTMSFCSGLLLAVTCQLI